ncbi:MAG: hypothetical protein ICV70_04785 [Jiangellaceae bacterium]|nr:hypothetical protein [Jiangellaceae bacterium]
MKSLSVRPRFARMAVAVLSMTVALLMTVIGAAHADRPTIIEEDNTGFACEYFPEGEPQVNVSINFDAVPGEGYSFTDVLSPDGELHLATGFTDDVKVGDGVVSARYPLLYPDGSVAGEVVLEGTYVASAEPVTLHQRFRYERNAQIIGTLVYTPLDVTWTTFQVGDYDVSGITCEGQRSQTTNRVLEPHRFVGSFSELRLLGNCTTDPLTSFSVVGSEEGVSLFLTVEGYEGFTNLDLDDGSDTQTVEWYAVGGNDLVEVTSITVTLTADGHRRSMVQATPDGLILEQIQPLTLSYELALPGGAGTVTGGCAAESVVTRTAVEPVA